MAAQENRHSLGTLPAHTANQAIYGCHGSLYILTQIPIAIHAHEWWFSRAPSQIHW
jgi:hypothetical protein